MLALGVDANNDARRPDISARITVTVRATVRAHLRGSYVDINEVDAAENPSRMYLSWAENVLSDQRSFFIFLCGVTLGLAPYSEPMLRGKNVTNSTLNDKPAAPIILDKMTLDTRLKLWVDFQPVQIIAGKTGVLRLIADYVGILRAKEQVILRGLVQVLRESYQG